MDTDTNAHTPAHHETKGSSLPLIGAVLMAGVWVAYAIFFFIEFANVV
jgi:hypothetical protein